jgi:LAS superfamily LD-carboxypeptidase LdcB
MKKNICAVFIMILAFFCSHEAACEVAYYILPEGRPYAEVGFSVRQKNVPLHFGDKVKIEVESVHGSVTWYFCSLGAKSFFLPESHVVTEPKKINFDGEGNIPIGSERVDKWTSLPLMYAPGDLAVIPRKYRARGYETRDLRLRKEAVECFCRLIDSAEADGVHIRVLSAFRSAEYQSFLYLNSIRRKGIFQNGVAKPGHSEHQLGTACDLTTKEIQYGLSREFESTAAFKWLMDHAPDYGISLTYPRHKVRLTGYMYEPWHYRYWSKDRWSTYQRTYGLFLTR